MKKKILFITIPFIMVMVILMLWINKTKPQASLKLNSDAITEISITRLPVPPKTKIINNKADMEKILSTLNSFELKKVQIDTINGWTYSVDVNEGDKAYTIIFCGNYLNINESWYELIDKEKTYDLLDKLYNDLDYKEEDI